jgi:hypothetical protein
MIMNKLRKIASTGALSALLLGTGIGIAAWRIDNATSC